ncbi:sel1 repeat family protein [Histomonas meleagridis]|uniref:sel1 repeat family protein n=1 Tax=Histomonas meleagridis TaxID=135588 RepID=UPI003559C8D0|nr:sel1 repeat family protein [Histomonas meleagridis]KAH0798318.1 sel1 repeat family protein [Histomonas meleagridis]
MYDWAISQIDQKMVEVRINCSSTFNINMIKGTLFDDNKSISVYVSTKDMPPILHGNLPGEASDINLRYLEEEHQVIVEIQKKDITEEWPIIVSTISSDNGIDPKSAFILATIIDQQGTNDQNVIRIAQEMFQYSISVGFPPALVKQAIAIINTYPEQALGILKMLSDGYDFPPAYFFLGSYLMTTDDQSQREYGVHCLEKASSFDMRDADYLLGKLYSPFDDSKYPPKDPKKSIEYFTKASQDENFEALSKYEMARIYYKGYDDIPKDEQRAKELFEEAKKLDPSLPDLESFNRKKIIGSIFAATAVTAFGVALFFHLRKRK